MLGKKLKHTNEYYDLVERYNGRNAKSIIKQLRQLIKTDPDYFDPYLFLVSILEEEGEFDKADRLVDEAYRQ